MATCELLIVGAGSAGCVLANRLSEDPDVRVLLLEAGGTGRHPSIAVPVAFAKQFRTKRDWDLATDPEPHCDGRELYVPRGRGLGGSSAMNAMLYVRGRPQDYDDWRDHGADGWGWDDVLPYFRRAEDHDRGPDELHGVGGPLRVVRARSPRPLTHRFVAAAKSAGLPYNADYNGERQDGVSPVQVTQHRGLRWSAANAYLRPAMGRPNLQVVTGAHALRVELRDGRAVGVRYRDGRGREQVAHASREVLLAAGAIGTPQLLMLSGIGPAEHLREHGIDVAHDLPGVGENLQDHPYVVCVWDSTVGGSLLDAERPRAMLELLLRRRGPLTSSVAEAFAFARSREDVDAPDLQLHFAPAYFVEHGFREHDAHAVTLGPVLITPQARGHVRLRSADPAAKPRMLTNTLGPEEDVAAMLAGVRLAREIAATEPLASATGHEHFPGAAVRSDEELVADLRRRVELLYHPVGTCRMGTGEQAVVDPQLRVRGIEALRVVDASVMPVITGGNTNAPTIMIAERGAALVRGLARPREAAAA